MTGRIIACRRARVPLLAFLARFQNLSDPGTDAIAVPQVAINDAGNAAFIWQLLDGAIQARSLSAAGALGPIQPIGQVSSEVPDPRLAIGADGKVVFVWSDGSVVDARVLTGAGVLGNAMTIAAQSILPSVAMDSAGKAIFVWKTNSSVQSRTLSASGVLRKISMFRRQRRLTCPRSRSTRPGISPSPGMCSTRSNTLVQARNRSAAGVFGPIRHLTPAGRDARNPQLGIDGGGNAVIVWSRHRRQWLLQGSAIHPYGGQCSRLDPHRFACRPARVQRPGRG